MTIYKYETQNVTIAGEGAIVSIDATNQKTYIVDGYKYNLTLNVNELKSNIEVVYPKLNGSISINLGANADIQNYSFQRYTDDQNQDNLLIVNQLTGNTVQITNYYTIGYNGFVSISISLGDVSATYPTSYSIARIPEHAETGFVYNVSDLASWVVGTNSDEVINTNSNPSVYSWQQLLVDTGAGNDTVNTTDDQYVSIIYSKNSGNDVLNVAPVAGENISTFNNTQVYIQDFNKNDLTFKFVGENLVISNNVDSGTLTINGYAGINTLNTNNALIFSNGDTVTFADLWNASSSKIDVVNGGSYTATLGELLNYTGTSGDDTIIGANGSDIINGGAGNDTLVGGSLAKSGDFNRLNGDDGNDTLITHSTTDILDGGLGNDTYIVEQSPVLNGESMALDTTIIDAGGNDTVVINTDRTYGGYYNLDDGIENVTVKGNTSWAITGNDLDNTITNNDAGGYLDGADGNDTLIGGAGDEIFGGGIGNNTLIGGGGNDTFYVNVGWGQENDTIISTGSGISRILVNGITSLSELKIYKKANDLIIESIGKDTITTIKDYFTTGSNVKTIGIDDYYNPQPEVNLADLIVPGVAVEVKTGTAAADKLTVVGDVAAEYYGLAGNDTLTGGKNDDYLDGGDGTDTLTGGAGTNTLVGGLGNDTFVVSSNTDIIVEKLNEGTDLVKSSVDFSLASNVENLTMTAAGLIGSGNELANTLTAHAGGSTLYGLAGNDKLVGGLGNDVLVGGLGNDTITSGGGNDTLDGGDGVDTLAGGAGINTLLGGAGADVLTGGTGFNTMYGGLDNDTYTVISKNDTVIENLNEGTDTVKTNVNFTLGANIENITMLAAGLIGSGNELANTLTAHAGGSTLYGLAGNDKLVGGLGNDVLVGGLGNDTITAGGGDNILDGGAGADILTGGTGTNTMYGGLDNDTYTVTNINDNVIENLNEGTDTVKTNINYTLGTNVENLTMNLAGLTGTGNELANTLTAHAGGSTLFGLAGNDKLVGGSGNDYLNGGDGADTITGGNGNNTLIGGAGNDSITGGTGVDDIRGGLGNDTLTGGVGSDIYHFGLGDGQDTINNTTIDTTVGRMDQLVFDSGVNADQLWFQKSGNNLVISVLNTTDKVTVTNWFTSTNNHIQDIISGDGLHLHDSQIDQMIQLTGIQQQPVSGHITGPALDVWGLS